MEQIAVIGGGIIGMSIAWRLAQAGFGVSVFEKSKTGGEASWAAAGMLAPGGEFENDSELARLALAARDLYPAFVQELRQESGLDIDLQETGALDVAYSATELTLLRERMERQAAFGIPAKQLNATQITTFWPRLRQEDLSGGIFYPRDAFVNPRDVMAALRVCCHKTGVTVLEQKHVSSVEIKTADTTARVQLDDADYAFAVIAGGAWSGSLAVCGVAPLPASYPVRGHLLGYKQPEQICNTIIRHRDTYLLQRLNGFFIAGASVEQVGFDRTIDPNAARLLERESAFLMPHLQETSPTEVWNGFRPASDTLHIGAWQDSPLYLAYGHYRNGILLAPITAQLITAGITASSQRR